MFRKNQKIDTNILILMNRRMLVSDIIIEELDELYRKIANFQKSLTC